LSDLTAFLTREGMTEETDFKGCVSKIIQLVHDQQERRSHYVQPCEGGVTKDRRIKMLDSLLKLWAKDNQRVDECFTSEDNSLPAPHAELPTHASEATSPKVANDDVEAARKKPSLRRNWLPRRVTSESLHMLGNLQLRGRRHASGRQHLSGVRLEEEGWY